MVTPESNGEYLKDQLKEEADLLLEHLRDCVDNDCAMARRLLTLGWLCSIRLIFAVDFKQRWESVCVTGITQRINELAVLIAESRDGWREIVFEEIRSETLGFAIILVPFLVDNLVGSEAYEETIEELGGLCRETPDSNECRIFNDFYRHLVGENWWEWDAKDLKRVVFYNLKVVDQIRSSEIGIDSKFNLEDIRRIAFHPLGVLACALVDEVDKKEEELKLKKGFMTEDLLRLITLSFYGCCGE